MDGLKPAGRLIQGPGNRSSSNLISEWLDVRRVSRSRHLKTDLDADFDPEPATYPINIAGRQWGSPLSRCSLRRLIYIRQPQGFKKSRGGCMPLRRRCGDRLSSVTDGRRLVRKRAVASASAWNRGSSRTPAPARIERSMFFSVCILRSTTPFCCFTYGVEG